MQTKNDYDKGVFNGDLGIVEDYNAADKLLLVNYDGWIVEYGADELDELTLSYAVSVHKSQGSEYDVVVLCLLPAHARMLSRELFYTAITRARKKLILLSDEATVARACANSQPVLRKHPAAAAPARGLRGRACGIIAAMEDLAPTPLLRQYQEIKKSYPDAILFFRLGDFYEMFFDDARTAAPILEVVLTSRNKNKEGAVPLCGVPHHAWENYAAKLLRKGFKVAICEQMEDPALAKGIVRREVTHILTPATALEVEALDAGLNNFIAVIRRDGDALALASMDLGVADFEVKAFAAGNDEALFNEFYRKFPKEIVIARGYENEFRLFVKRFPEFAGILATVYDDARVRRAGLRRGPEKTVPPGEHRGAGAGRTSRPRWPPPG